MNILYATSFSGKKKLFTVVIDPGHGGKDPGTVWKNVYEKDIALGIALKLGNNIRKNIPDVKVIFTRETDVFIDLYERAPIANKNQADLFISIHVNANEKSVTADGTETYAMGLAKTNENLEVAKKENAVILKEKDYSSKYDGYDPNSPESFIIFSLLQNNHLEQSLNFANYVQQQFQEKAKRNSRGVKQACFLVLWKTTMPSVLIETGFLSNAEERAFITSEHGQEVLATSIFRAFRKYKEDYEGRNASVAIVKPEEDSLKNDNKTKETPKVSISQSADTTAVVDAVEFMVQINSSKSPVQTNPEYFKGLKNTAEIKIGDNYKYTVGRSQNYKEVVEYSKIVKNYFPDAFIIAVRKGKIIPLKDALKEIKN